MPILKRLLIVTTVAETLATILNGQPKYLSKYFKVSLITSPGEYFSNIEGNESVDVFPLKMTRGINVIKDVYSLIGMIKLIRNIQPDAVHSYTPKAGLIAMLASYICRVPTRVHTFTGLIFPTAHGVKKSLLIFIDKIICYCATTVIPEGEGVKNDLLNYGVTNRPLKVIGRGNIAGVNTFYFNPDALGVRLSGTSIRTQQKIEANCFVFCFVGRIHHEKGIRELFSAFTDLPPSCHLLVVGALDKTASVGRDVFSELERHPRVHIMGFLDDIRPALSASNVLVLPSYREGFPNVLLQAGAMALPVIATDVNGSREIVQSGVNGWLVPPRDAAALKWAMKISIDTLGIELHRMGQNAREIIVQQFERKDHLNRMLAFYQNLLNNNRFLMIASFADSLLNFRGQLIVDLIKHGVKVHVVAPDMSATSSTLNRLEDLGVVVHNLAMERKGINPYIDLITIFHLMLLLIRIKPIFVFSYTIKPVVYGSLIGWLCRVPKRFAMITGLGYSFNRNNSGNNILTSFTRILYVISLARVNKVFFQNSDDMAFIQGLSPKLNNLPACLVNGSGIDLVKFNVVPLPFGAPHFLLIARLLVSKGVREYAQVARSVRSKHPDVRFSLVGWIDEGRDSISHEELVEWQDANVLDYLGRMDDVRPAIAECSVFVLPSYREGTPRTVLESMSMGRAIITTDAPGCRETVVEGENGFLVSVGSVSQLELAVLKFINDPTLAPKMGKRSRQIAEMKYDVHKINEIMLREMGID